MDNSWSKFLAEMRQRFIEPFSSGTFVIFFVITIALSGIGVWLAWYFAYQSGWENRESQELYRSLITYFVALGAVASAQLGIVGENPTTRAFFILFLVAFSMIGAACWLLYVADSSGLRTTILVMTIAAAIVWWLANGKGNPMLDEVEPENSTGGDVNKDIAGDTKGFKI